MIKAHPEIKKLFGNYAGTAFWCIFCAGLQVSLAASCAHLPWWGMLLLAYVLGGVINTQLFQLAHECDHNLVFKKTFWNRYLFTLTSLPMFLSGHHTWWVEHFVFGNRQTYEANFNNEAHRNLERFAKGKKATPDTATSDTAA